MAVEAGLTAAREATRRGARTAIISDGPLGGDCTHTGCVYPCGHPYQLDVVLAGDATATVWFMNAAEAAEATAPTTKPSWTAIVSREPAVEDRRPPARRSRSRRWRLPPTAD